MPQPPITEEMKAWATALAAETADWPHLSQRSFFGFTALYRGETIFAMLPRSKNLESVNTIAFKIKTLPTNLRERLASDRRIGAILQENSPWYTFLLSSNTDLHDALDWLGHAYTAASKRKVKRSK